MVIVEGEYLTVADVCRMLHVHENTVYRWITERGLPHKRVGRKYLFLRADVLAWVESVSPTGDAA